MKTTALQAENEVVGKAQLMRAFILTTGVSEKIIYELL
jgi:hypothetical protein